MSVDMIELWHKRARPEPTPANFNVQLGCHFEEICEMLETLRFETDSWTEVAGSETAAYNALHQLADSLKKGKVNATIANRKMFADSVGDQVVTVIGAAYTGNMKAAKIVEAVDASNWSKYDENGKPLFDRHGKIKKGHKYKEPNLEGLY